MARADGNTASGDAGGDGGGGGSLPVVDIGSVIESSNATGDSSDGTSNSGGKRTRRTRAQLEAAGYYSGGEKAAPRAATAKKGNLDVNSIQFALTGIHSLLSVALTAPELELSEKEAETVAQNIVAVGRHYDLQQTAKATDWGNLIVALGVVYGGRIMSIGIRKKAEKASKRGSVAPGTGFTPTPPNVAPQQPQVKEPAAGGKVTSRPKTREDDVFLNEQEVFLAP